jgi:hypothetical protein
MKNVCLVSVGLILGTLATTQVRAQRTPRCDYNYIVDGGQPACGERGGNR